MDVWVEESADPGWVALGVLPKRHVTEDLPATASPGGRPGPESHTGRAEFLTVP